MFVPAYKGQGDERLRVRQTFLFRLISSEILVAENKAGTGRSACPTCALCSIRHNNGALATSLLITGASQLLTLRGSGPRRGAALADLGIIKDGALLVRDGVIAAVGTRAKIEALPEAAGAEKLDLGGRVVLPGFVDSHTHLIHAASRAEEYELKIAGREL